MLVEAIKPSIDIQEVERRFIRCVLQLLQLSAVESRRLAEQNLSDVSWTRSSGYIARVAFICFYLCFRRLSEFELFVSVTNYNYLLITGLSRSRMADSGNEIDDIL